MQAQPTVPSSPRRDQRSTERTACAQILPFPIREAADPDPATALDRIVSSLTSKQAHELAHEIEVLNAALSLTPGPQQAARAPEGVRPRHSERCSLKHGGGACDCDPSWEASVWSSIEKRKIRKTLPTRGEAISWRRQHLGLAESGQLRTPTRMTLAETADTWVEMAQAGKILNRSGRPYKPSALRTIEQDIRLRLKPSLGVHAMSEIARADLQHHVGIWLAHGLSSSKVHGTVNAARVLWRDFDLITGADNLLPVDPTRGLRLPAVTGRRDRIATSDEARRLLAALDEEDRVIWATAMYAGVRHGELRALRVENIDLERKRIQIRHGWDQYEGEIDPKSEKGKRTTIIINLLAELLKEHLQRTGRTGADLIFGRTPTLPFDSNTIYNRARKAWNAAREQEDKEDTISIDRRIREIGLHECRHTAVSHMLDAGITIDKVSKFMGHSSITVTIDRYGHLLPGGEAEAAALLDAYHAHHRR
jgi:integrase